MNNRIPWLSHFSATSGVLILPCSRNTVRTAELSRSKVRALRRVLRSLDHVVGAGPGEFSPVECIGSVEISNSSVTRTIPPVGSEERVSSVPSVKRCVPVASVKRQLRTVASPSVVSASPRDVLASTLNKCKRVATAEKFKRTLERLAPCSSSVALRQPRSSSVVLH